MKKSLTTLSTLALFAGAAMAEESYTKIWSVDNQDSYTVAAGEYVRAEGYYYNTTGEQHRGPMYNVGTATIDGIFESYVDASAQSMLGAQKVLGSGELRINSALFLSPNTDFSGFTGNVDVQRGVLWFVDSKNSPVNVSEFNLSGKGMLKLTNGDFVINGAVKGSGNIHVTLYPNDEIESGVYVIKNATPANLTIKGDISQYNGTFDVHENSKIRLETKLNDSVSLNSTVGGTLELVGAAGDAKKTITVDSHSDSSTVGNVFMYGNNVVIANNSRKDGIVDENCGYIYFGGNHEYTQENLVSYTFDKSTVLGDSAGNVVMGGRGDGALTAKGVSAKVVDGVKVGKLVIGGADGATVEGNTHLVVESGEINAIYGGLNGVHNGSTTIEVTGGKIGRIYGADGVGGTVNGNTNISVKDATVGEIYGSNYAYDKADETKFGGINGNVTITVDGNSKVGQIRGGINTNNQESEAIAKEKMVLGGSVTVNVAGNAVVGNGDVAILGGGGSYGSVKEHVSVKIAENATVNGDVFAGANSVDGDTRGNLPYVGKDTWLSVNDNATVNGNLFGGSRRYGVVKNNAYTYVNGGTVNGNVYGGGQQGSTVEGMSVVRANGGVIKGDIYGGGRNGGVVNKQTYVQTYEGATIEGNIYGGGENGTVNGFTQIEIYGNSDIKGDIYGGGKGADSKVLGGSSIRFVSNSNFTGVVDGAGQDGGTVAGSRGLTFGGWESGDKWDGDFNGKIKNINSVVLTNGSNVSNLRFDMTEPMNFGGEGTLEVITNLVGKNIDTSCLVNVIGSAPLDITFKDSTFSGNTINNNSYGVFLHWGAGKMAFDGTTIENNTITRNDGDKIQGVLYYNGSGSGEIVNTMLKNNTVSGTQVQSSGLFVYKQDLDVNGSQFIGNRAIGSNGAKLTSGAVYVENQGNVAKTVNISDTLFDGNVVENTGNAEMGKGGALAVIKRNKRDSDGNLLGAGVNVVLNDAMFTNNSAGKGGAIYVGGETLTINATKSATFSGNTAANGGFLYMDNGEAGSTASANVSINVANGATLTIGKEGSSSDSIEGVDSATLTKGGAGSLNVNGSMSGFNGSLVVSEGAMNVNNGLGAKSVSIAENAVLGVTLGNCALEVSTVVNNGTLNLRRGTLSSDFVLSDYSGTGKVEAFGGVMSGSTFVLGKKEDFTSSAIRIGNDLENDAQSVFYADGENTLGLDFNVADMGDKKLTISSIETVSDAGNISGDFLGGFSVTANNGEGADFSVVFSAYVGNVEDIAKLRAWHKADGSDIWTLLETEIDYADGIASIIVDGFSSYAFSQVPEPADYAAILGAIAIAFALKRKAAALTATRGK